MTTRMCHDPSREDMLAYLARDPEFDEFDREEAIYWFAYDWHGGQASNLYAALSASPFTPGVASRGPCGMAVYAYDALEAEYITEI